MSRARRINIDDVRTVVRLSQGGLFWKYVAMFAAVLGVALIGNGLVNIWVMYEENRANLQRLQREQVVAAADKISQFVEEIRIPARLDDTSFVGGSRARATRAGRAPIVAAGSCNHRAHAA